MNSDDTTSTETIDSPAEKAEEPSAAERSREDATQESTPQESAQEATTQQPTAEATTQQPTAEATTQQPTPEQVAQQPAAQRTEAAGGFGAGAAAVASAGLGVISLTGTSLGDMLRARGEIVGQISASSGGGGNPVEALYGTPWHTAAFVNGIFALVAVLIGGVTLAVCAGRTSTQPWVRAVALGGVVLGGIGVIVTAGMALDLFAAQPAMPTMGGAGG
ncbi:hypothetical protein FHX42_000387 [Saccharopolyspora lacisalsi]|uniref:Uncharacterized protein n=1 Tax=Halosaccharopolyspora lacisalsi TaxID=1000566 RepID=A0A839DWA5_9PSEU|nr:hypothetical protein [Halosaccharopolyspora lacisalsi]MBA8823058.1 hypothetical protein [Halosaccharopolyspora lacisalsi]